jgi:hypothetical protein
VDFNDQDSINSGLGAMAALSTSSKGIEGGGTYFVRDTKPRYPKQCHQSWGVREFTSSTS